MGILIQKYDNGTQDEMNVEATRVGSDFTMGVTAMRSGKPRRLNFKGVVIGKQILASISGIAATGKPATGFARLKK